MHTIELPDIKYSANIPANLWEMSNEDFVFFAHLLHELLHRGITVNDLKTRMAFRFLRIKYSRRKYYQLSPDARLMVSSNIYRISELLDYFFSIEESGIRVNLECTRNFVPVTGSRFRKLYGPADALTDISMLEYKDADTQFRQYLKTGSIDDLNRLVAILYRPRVKGKRLPYDPDMIDSRMKQVERIPIGERFAVYLFYASCDNFLHSGSFEADGITIDLAFLYEVTMKERRMMAKLKYKDDTGYTGLAYSLARTGIYGTLEDVFRQNLYDVLVLLYHQRIDYLNQLENITIE